MDTRLLNAVGVNRVGIAPHPMHALYLVLRAHGLKQDKLHAYQLRKESRLDQTEKSSATLENIAQMDKSLQQNCAHQATSAPTPTLAVKPHVAQANTPVVAK